MGLFKKISQSSKEFISKFLADEFGIKPSVSQTIPAPPPKDYSPIISLEMVPPSIDGMTQAYRYEFELSALDDNALKNACESCNYIFDVEQADGVTYATVNGSRLGIVPERYDMIADWIKRGDPMRLFLKRYIDGGTCLVKMVFYKDKAAPHRWREQTVVPLISYKNRDIQDSACCVYEKEEVKIGEIKSGDGRLLQCEPNIVSCDGYAIGKIPAKIAKRIAENDYSYAEIEEVLIEENDNYDADDFYHPVIRIYW